MALDVMGDSQDPKGASITDEDDMRKVVVERVRVVGVKAAERAKQRDDQTNSPCDRNKSMEY
jgi:hypothetical protein